MFRICWIGLYFFVAISSWALTAQITSPVDGFSFVSGTTLNISAVANNPAGVISKVRLYLNGVSHDSLSAPPFNFQLQNLSPGSHFIQVQALDPVDSFAMSEVVRVYSRGKIDPFTSILGVKYFGALGITPEITSGGIVLGFIHNGDFTSYDSLNFGTSVAKSVTFTTASPGGGMVEIHLDSLNGKKIGSCIIPGNGNWTSKTNTTCGIQDVSGVHRVFFKYQSNHSGYLFNLYEFSFSTAIANSPPQISFLLPTPNATLNAPSNVVVEVSASDDKKVTQVQLWSNGAYIGSDSSSPYQFTVPLAFKGKAQLLAKAFDENKASRTATLNLNVQGISLTKKYWAYNAGGPKVIGSDGIEYQADTSMQEKTFLNIPVLGSGDSVLFETQRYGASFNYSIPVASGNYRVILKFSEAFHNQVGKRIFNVLGEDVILIENLDVYKEVGLYQALEITRTVNVQDGTLNLQFVGKSESAMLTALAVIEDSLYTEISKVQPILVSPANQAVLENEMVLKWMPLKSASKHHVQVALDSSFSTIAYENKEVPLDTFVEINPFKGVKFYWRVRSYTDNGWSPYSEIRNFTTKQGVTSKVNSSFISEKPLLMYRNKSLVFNLSSPASISIELHNSQGEKLLVSQTKTWTEGIHSVSLDHLNLNTGIWFAKIKVDQQMLVKKLVISR